MLLEQLRQAVKRYHLLEEGDRIVVAVSGGPDSMALLHALGALSERKRWKLCAAHLHHGLRGDEADRDLELVRSLAELLEIPLHVDRLPQGALEGAGLEARAREARYEFLHRVAARVGSTRIATGHTRDDQAETVLLRLLRGSGPKGLAGIQPKRADGVVRPLILTTRSDVLAYLKKAGLAYGEDQTNQETRFLRNRVRHELIPQLRELSPRIVDHLASLAEALSADEAYLDAEARRVGAPWLDAGRSMDRALEGTALSNREALAKLPHALRVRVLIRMLEQAGVPSDRVSTAIGNIDDHLSSGSSEGGLDLGGGVRVRWDARGIHLGSAEIPPAIPYDCPLAIPGEVRIPDGRVVRSVLVEKGSASGEMKDIVDQGHHRGAQSAVYDLNLIMAPLRVRNRRPGDRIRPRGFGHRRKLQDVLTDAHIPRAMRDHLPVVVMGEEVLWVAGVMASEVGRPSESTAHCLVITLTPNSGDAEAANVVFKRGRD